MECPQGYVEKLVVENFKSYAGRHEIGPFKRFSCIIGPNGSGKSNVMDALSFVLGIQAKHLRGERLIDLVYRREDESAEDLDRVAVVTLIFVMPGNTRDKMHIARIINAKGESQYKYGCGNPPKLRNIDFEGLQKHLKEVNIYVRARNFLVFQGDVMDLARRQGLELTRILETISGSDELKSDMDQLEVSKRIAEEKQRVFFAKKRKTDQHKCELEREKSDLDKYQQLQEESKRLKLEGYLFGLYTQEKQIERGRRELQKVQLIVKEKTALFEDKQKANDELMRTRKKLQSQVATYETEFKKFQVDANEWRCEKESLVRQLHNVGKSMHESQVRQEELQSSIAHKKEAMAGMKADLDEAYSALEEVKKEITDKDKDIFTPEQRKLWNDAEIGARTLSRTNKAELDDMLEQLSDLRSIGKDLERRRTELMGHREEVAKRLSLNRRNVDLHSKEIDSAETSIARDEKKLAPIEMEVAELKSALQSFIDDKKSIERNLADMKEQRQIQTATRYERDIVTELKSNFPGVVERVNELIVPSSVTGSNALNAALGGNRYFLVCDTSHTAHQCISHLKKHKREQLTFLPLDTIRPNVVKGLHVLVRKNGRKLATGICKPNTKFYESPTGKAFESEMQRITDSILNATLGDCIVSEKLNDARMVAYDESRKQQLRCRVVTLGGDMIRANGNMVSADNRNSGNFGQKTSQAEEQKSREAVRAINEDMDETTTRIMELNYEMETLKTNIKSNNELIRQGGGRSNVTCHNLKKDEELSQKIAKDLQDIEMNVAQNRTKLEQKETDVAACENRMLELGNHFYEAISKKMKVPNIRVIVADRKKALQAKQAELSDLDELILSLKADVTRTKASIRDEDIVDKRLTEDLKKKEKNLQAVQEKCEKCEQSATNADTRLTDKRKQYRDAKSEFDLSENRLNSMKSELAKVKSELTQAQNLERKTNKVRSMTHAKYKDLEQAHMDGALIPTLECPNELQEGDAVGGQLFEVERNAEQIEEVLNKIKIDFSLLDEEAKDLACSPSDEIRMEAKDKYKQLLEAVQKSIEDLPQSLNLNAQQEYIELCARFKDQTEEAEQMVKTSQELQRKYEVIRDERFERFMSCFREIEKEVDPIYKELTTFDDREGGSAFLDLECPDEPFAGGTLFTACPPGKRFFDMSLLSGGEKSMASMALLMAMHSHAPPPFMILDEVDAPFDRKNTDALVRFLKKMPFQSIVISLKDKFFCHADACVGIYKDKALQTSGALTIGLDDISDDEG